MLGNGFSHRKSSESLCVCGCHQVYSLIGVALVTIYIHHLLMSRPHSWRTSAPIQSKHLHCSAGSNENSYLLSITFSHLFGNCSGIFKYFINNKNGATSILMIRLLACSAWWFCLWSQTFSLVLWEKRNPLEGFICCRDVSGEFLLSVFKDKTRRTEGEANRDDFPAVFDQTEKRWFMVDVDEKLQLPLQH